MSHSTFQNTVQFRKDTDYSTRKKTDLAVLSGPLLKILSRQRSRFLSSKAYQEILKQLKKIGNAQERVQVKTGIVWFAPLPDKDGIEVIRAVLLVSMSSKMSMKSQGFY